MKNFMVAIVVGLISSVAFAQNQGTRAVQTQWNHQPQNLVRSQPQGNWNGGGNWNRGGNWNNGRWNNGQWNNNTNWNVNIGVGPGWGGCWNCWNTWGPGPIIYQQSAPVIIWAPPVVVQPSAQQRLAQIDQWLLNGQITFDQANQMRVNVLNGQ